MWRTSTVRVPSVSTRRSRTPSTVAFLPDLARWSGLTVAGAATNLLEERPARLVRDHRDAFARERAHAARVVEVVMADDEVLDRLVRHERARFLDDGQRAVVVERALDDDQVVLHLDHHAVMRAAGHVPHPVGGLLALTRT